MILWIQAKSYVYLPYAHKEVNVPGSVSVNLQEIFDITLISTSFTGISVGEDLPKKFRIVSFAHIRMAPD